MKVLQINSVCGFGSTGRIMADIHEMLLAKNYESHVAYGRGNTALKENTITIGSKPSVYSHVLKTRILDLHGFGSRKATEEFLEKVEELNPDIIHLHNIHGYYMNVERLFDYLKKAGKPVIWTLHDCWAFTGHCTHFDYIGCDRWKTGCFSCPQKKSYPKSDLWDNSKFNYKHKKEIFSGVDDMTIVTPSVWLADLVRESFLGGYPVKTINNGVNIDLFKPTPSSFKEENGLQEKFMILGVASVWSKQKGFDYFLELSKKLTEREVVVLVGVTEEQKELLPANIVGITRTSNQKELIEIYSTADVFVNPTLQDTFPTTNIEAMACGVPVITFDSGGSAEIINSETGIKLENKTVDSLRASITKVKMSSSNFIEKGQLRAQSKFDKQEKFSNYIKLYKEKVKTNKLQPIL
ncbi:glycosyltransferase [Thalassobacillus devorans]|uniref:glycosyltransferase n=1 Tax=Thalassobacillus devorans TaxID=279813 RepID=UPI00048D261E|nr:glycosyltransferase [Thalassobacillus devorans]